MDFSSKLAKLQIEKQKLIEKRLFEIAKLGEKADVLSLDNDLILGALLLAKEAYEKTVTKTLEDLKTRAKKIPSRKKSLLKKAKDFDKASA